MTESIPTPDERRCVSEVSDSEVVGYSEFIARLYSEKREKIAKTVLDILSEDYTEEQAQAFYKYYGQMGH